MESLTRSSDALPASSIFASRTRSVTALQGDADAMDAVDAMNPHIPDVHGDAILVIMRAASLHCSIALDQGKIPSLLRFALNQKLLA